METINICKKYRFQAGSFQFHLCDDIYHLLYHLVFLKSTYFSFFNFFLQCAEGIGYLPKRIIFLRAHLCVMGWRVEKAAQIRKKHPC
jgi:hypothetical protein